MTRDLFSSPDHLIVAGPTVLSFSGRGLLRLWELRPPPFLLAGSTSFRRRPSYDPVPPTGTAKSLTESSRPAAQCV